MNRTKFDEIKSILLTYKVEVNSIAKTYTSQLKRYKEAFNADYFEEKRNELRISEKAKLDSLRSATKSKLDATLTSIQSELHTWSADTSKLELIQSLGTVKAAGVKLSLPEISSLLDKSEGNYLAAKLLSQIAKESGYNVDFPCLEDYEKELRQVESSANTMLQCYCGSELELESLLSDNIQHGVSYGKYPAYILATSDAILKPDGVLDGATKLWSNNECLTVNEKTLSEVEMKHLDSLFDGYSGRISERTAELLKINPQLRESLLLHPTYEQFVPVDNN